MTFVDLLSEYHIMPQFPPSVIRWLESVPTEVQAKDLEGRTDLTQKEIFTIDGDDAKDFDDAVSLEVLENGNFFLGVHIADVSNYVVENSPIDRAAFSRGTSVYLIDTVIPMLPFELSNELCSLKPGCIRLTVSVFAEINKQGETVDFKICNSYIKSVARMTYSNVTRILEGDLKLREKYRELVPALTNMQRLAELLRKNRLREGSIEFETNESLIILDKKGTPEKVEKYPISVSNGIIEEFMLCANVIVAKHLTQNGLPCVYRVHEKPDFDRVQRLAKVLPELGVDFRFKPDMKPKDFQRVLESVSSLDIDRVVNYLVLRTMSRAKYSEKNLGHFGLSFSDYCHFTSPIRRYPDVIVHRILKESLKGSISEKRIQQLKEIAVSASVTSSIAESNAADAEQRWKEIKKAEYMAMHLGEKYDASITHITQTGFFAELLNTVEGFVAAKTITDDVYMMTENGLALEGMRTKNRFTIGDKVEIKVISADYRDGKIDFEIAGKRYLKAYQRKNCKGHLKKQLNKSEKRVLKEFKERHQDEKLQKRNLREKADAERIIFENAIVYELFDLLKKNKRFNKSEERFIGETLRDLAASVSVPIYKNFVFDSENYEQKNAYLSASVATQNTMQLICESFGIEFNKELKQISTKYVGEALRHLVKCMVSAKLNHLRREDEYIEIIRRIELQRSNFK